MSRKAKELRVSGRRTYQIAGREADLIRGRQASISAATTQLQTIIQMIAEREGFTQADFDATALTIMAIEGKAEPPPVVE